MSNIVFNLPFVCEMLSYRLLGSTRSPSPILIRVDLCLKVCLIRNLAGDVVFVWLRSLPVIFAKNMFHGFVVNAIEWRIVFIAIIIAEFHWEQKWNLICPGHSCLRWWSKNECFRDGKNKRNEGNPQGMEEQSRTVGILYWVLKSTLL